MRDLSEKIHQKGVEYLANRLMQKPHEAVLINVPYKTENYEGELDVVRIYKGRADIYEVKTHHSNIKREQAKEQLLRVKKAFPNWDVRLIYYPLNGSQKAIK